MWESARAGEGKTPAVALALLYANGDLGPEEAAAFDRLLGEDQSARDRLCQAVQLLHAIQGQPPLHPSPACREAARRRLLGRATPTSAPRAHPSLWQRPVRGQAYPGHPALWAGLGAAVAVLVTLLLPVDQPGDRPAPTAAVTAESHPTSEAPTPLPAPAEDIPPTPRLTQQPAEAPAPPGAKSGASEAEVWAQLPSSEHLARAHEEEARRKDRQEAYHSIHEGLPGHLPHDDSLQH
jgi:hypothetical protein